MRSSWPGCGRTGKEDLCDATSNKPIFGGKNPHKCKVDSSQERRAHLHGKTTLYERGRTHFVFLIGGL